MKNFKKIVSVLMTAAVCTLLFSASTLKTSAAEPTTYSLKYLPDEGGWRFHIGAWNDNVTGREAYYLSNGDQKIKDGDIIVIYSNGADDYAAPLEVNVRLSNLTLNRASAVVHAKGIDECYILGGSSASINGDVKNAYVYESCVSNFNNNVGNLNIYSSALNVTSKVSVNGTVDHMTVRDNDGIFTEAYNFAAGKLKFDGSGYLATAESDYSKTPSASSKPAQSSGSSDEYDDVPKTGDDYLLFCLLGISVLCFAGSFATRKIR